MTKTRHVLRLSDFPDGETHLLKLCDGQQTEQEAKAIKDCMSVVFQYPRMSRAFLKVVYWLNGPRRRREHREYRKWLAAQRAQQPA